MLDVSELEVQKELEIFLQLFSAVICEGNNIIEKH